MVSAPTGDCATLRDYRQRRWTLRGISTIGGRARGAQRCAESRARPQIKPRRRSCVGFPAAKIRVQGRIKKMPHSRLSVFKEWRTADQQAHALEQAVSRAFLGALEGRGESPSAEQRDQARALRQTADKLFELAMAEMKNRADTNRS
jgi:hypothetical protein